MNRTSRALLTVAVPATLLLSGCAQPTWDGEAQIVELDYNAAETKKVRKKTSSGAKKTTTKRVPEEWDVTVRTTAGKTYEIDVTEACFNTLTTMKAANQGVTADFLDNRC